MDIDYFQGLFGGKDMVQEMKLSPLHANCSEDAS